MYRYFELILAMGTAWAISGILRFSHPVKRKSPDAPFVIAVIIVFLLSIFDNLLRPHLLSMSVLRFIYPVTRLSYYLVGPALWFYVRILLKDNFELKAGSLLHLFPFLFWFIYVLIEPASLHPEIPFGETSSVGAAQPASPVFSLAFLWDVSANLSRLLYSAAILVLLRKNKKQLPDRVSSINSRNTLSWLGNLVIFYTGIYLISSLIYLIFPVESQLVQITAAVGRSLPAVLFVFLFSFFSQDQPILAEKEEFLAARKYEKSGMTDIESRTLYSELNEHITEKKVYLEPELTLEMLAQQMGETRHRLSEVINREAGKKFYNFINDFRLNEFRDAVKEDRYPDYTIIAIAFECGFRSSSAFYSLIKKELGTTPKALVQEIQSS